MIKFYYNGIKSSDKDGLQKARFWFNKYEDGSTKMTIQARDYERFSKEIRANFIVKNETDSMTDYFDSDSITVEKNHPFAGEVARVVMLNIKRNKYASEEEKERQTIEVLEWLSEYQCELEHIYRGFFLNKF